MLKQFMGYRYVVVGGLLICSVWVGLEWLAEAEAAPRPKLDVWLLPMPEGAPLKIGPVEGLTSRWYSAPQSTSIPLGAVVLLRLQVESESTVAWSGAYEVERDATHSTAECPLTAAGQQVARAVVSQFAWRGTRLRTPMLTVGALNESAAHWATAKAFRAQRHPT